MKIGLVTLPLTNHNYGGLLQAWALQRALEGLGHHAVSVDLRYPRSGLFRELRCQMGSLLRGRGLIPSKEPQRRAAFARARHLVGFHQNRIVPTTRPMESASALRRLAGEGFDAFVVGSDQVWRGKYIQGLESSMFLDFTRDPGIRKISYAASFGKDALDPNLASRRSDIATMLSRFTAVSVRETSGIELCRREFGIEARLVLDPTMLIPSSSYLELLEEPFPPTGFLCTYLLDASENKSEIVDLAIRSTGLPPRALSSSDNAGTSKDSLLPSISDWIGSIARSEFVVTDSFHGTVFSILFRKPFLVIGNQERGIDRFVSLLDAFGLLGRLVSDVHGATSALETNIDFDAVHRRLDTLRADSFDFLQQSLERRS